ncbi:Uvr/REP helicase [Invertebrate iridescent virus 30]|uniref:Uvr/REP helicase n=1 Tax=Invertebrate iridescent virus 30 TaxID=345585 RepID=W8W1V2_9VIRU|nr:Uvr/REP helicase [Invertebrate iridescent virus 30]CCV02358.1 Uvr/REP helicase [Invertebrate iridescent virus 30]
MKSQRKKSKQWFEVVDDDSWYLYALIFGCFGILILVLIHRKLTKQKGRWSSTLNFNNIYRYTPSVESTKESKGEIECRKYLETIFQLPFPKARPNFLKNPITGNNLEIDCFNPELKLGVEYNGQQHYRYTSFFHRNIDAATNQKYRDELKRRMCHENGITLIEVPYTIKLNDIGRYLQFKLREVGYL